MQTYIGSPGASVADQLTTLPAATVKVAWDGTNFVDETSHLLSLEITSEVVPPTHGLSALALTTADKAKIVLANDDHRYSPHRIDTRICDQYGGYLKPVTIDLGFTAGQLRQFTGVIVNPVENWQNATVSLDCQDRWVLVDRRIVSSPLYRNTRVDQLLLDFFTLAGFTAAPYSWSTNLEISERYIPWAWLHHESLRAEMGRIAEADGGVVWFDKTGTLRYFSASWPARHTTVASPGGTFSPLLTYESLTPKFIFDQVFDRVEITVKPRYVGALSEIWRSGEEISLEPGGSTDALATFNNPVVEIEGPTYVVPTQPNGLASLSDWVAVTAANSALEGSGGLRIQLYNSQNQLLFDTANPSGAPAGSPDAQSVRLHLINQNATQRMYVKTLRLRGKPVVGGKEFTVTTGPVNYTQALALNNAYYQTRLHAQAVANVLSNRAQNPRDQVTLKAIPPQPHLELLDRVTVSDTSGTIATGISEDFFIGRIHHVYSPAGGYWMDLDLMSATAWTPNLNYAVIGTTVWGPSGQAGSGRLWQ